jgi:hypothetical protein
MDGPEREDTMTTTVKKGTGRPAAAARKAKAAQQAPTKPAPADVQPGVPIDTTGLEKLSLGELRQLAHALGFSTATKERKAALVRIIRDNPAGPRGERKPAKANGKAAPKVRTFRPITEGLSGDGASKAACVARLLEEAGWKVTMPKGGTSLKATRGAESLTMAWTARGGHDPSGSAYRAAEDSKPKRVINVATGLRFARGGAS